MSKTRLAPIADRGVIGGHLRTGESGTQTGTGGKGVVQCLGVIAGERIHMALIITKHGFERSITRDGCRRRIVGIGERNNAARADGILLHRVSHLEGVRA